MSVEVPPVLAGLYASLDEGQRRDLVESLWQLDRVLDRRSKAELDAMRAMTFPFDEAAATEHSRLSGRHSGLVDAGDYLRDVADALEGNG